MEDTKKLLNDKTIHLLDISNNNDSKCKIERKSLIILKTIIKNICNHLLSITTLKKTLNIILEFKLKTLDKKLLTFKSINKSNINNIIDKIFSQVPHIVLLLENKLSKNYYKCDKIDTNDIIVLKKNIENFTCKHLMKLYF